MLLFSKESKRWQEHLSTGFQVPLNFVLLFFLPLLKGYPIQEQWVAFKVLGFHSGPAGVGHIAPSSNHFHFYILFISLGSSAFLCPVPPWYLMVFWEAWIRMSYLNSGRHLVLFVPVSLLAYSHFEPAFPLESSGLVPDFPKSFWSLLYLSSSTFFSALLFVIFCLWPKFCLQSSSYVHLFPLVSCEFCAVLLLVSQSLLPELWLPSCACIPTEV